MPTGSKCNHWLHKSAGSTKRRNGCGFAQRRPHEPGTPDTPAALRRCADTGGHLGILDRRLIGFFCSVCCPGDVILKTYDLARMLRETDVTIVGGFLVASFRGMDSGALCVAAACRAGACSCGVVSVRRPAWPRGDCGLCDGHQRADLGTLRISAPWPRSPTAFSWPMPKRAATPPATSHAHAREVPIEPAFPIPLGPLRKVLLGVPDG